MTREELVKVNYISVSNNQHFEVLHLLSPVFTGRDEDLKSLTASFVAINPSQNQHQRRFVLFGLGGSGKTQICLKYIQEHRESDLPFGCCEIRPGEWMRLQLSSAIIVIAGGHSRLLKTWP
ncbi:hypothetical protein DL95DRAFT_147084 [Leptodontidium sp. 2 PMI_412]|nr:hypothetical protein DL95DRAFT_147084 [Leptodontidium sp. 2 PMI_412]